jgi:isopentenyl diphosphate isomerase/L-lactate dehydrogenase-like FMN-dependent dehydrogenase
MNKTSLSTIADYEKAAMAKLSAGLANYIQKSAGEGKTFKANLSVFEKYQLFPQVLKGIVAIDTKTQVLGKTISAPIMIAPTAWHKMFSPNGEADTAAATKAFGIPYVISSFSTLDFGEISNDLSNSWYQILVYKDKSLMKKWIKKAETAGCSAIVITVDAPLGCSMCKVSASNIEPVKFPIHDLPLFPTDPTLPYKNLDEYYPQYMGSDSNWEDIKEVISYTNLPVILKGILHVEDAEKAIEVGAKGIIISNHGGRQLDNAITSLDALALMPQSVKDRIEVYMDSGIRKGSDIFKALALGAKAVLIGRAALYGISVNGKEGLESVLRILRNELKTSMHMTGCSKVAEITSKQIFKQS